MSSSHGQAKGGDVRARLDHPVIDGDGHVLEFTPVFLDYLKGVAGADLVQRFNKMTSDGGLSSWYALSPEQRRDRRATRPAFWFSPMRNTADRATAMLPQLLRQRMEEIGLDFIVVYTTMGLLLVAHPDEELRRGCCRALNLMLADMYRGHGERMTPAALIPMHTPEEGLEELDFAVGELGFKAIMIDALVRRRLPEIERAAPEAAHCALWPDPLALDSPHDYDPFWARCLELKVVPTAHSGSTGLGMRNSISNYTYNHIGNFAAANEAFCKALFMGGVTRRFPALNFAFLEGGVSWACQLFSDLIEHWEKRGSDALAHIDPANMDRELLVALFRQHGGPWAGRDLETELAEGGNRATNQADYIDNDEFAACAITRTEDIRDLFVPRFYFGCEADDRMNAWAFNEKTNPFGARLKAMFSSDIGHWDVPDMTHVLPEAYELVEDGLMTEADFHDFVFANPASLHREVNPDFYKGTAVEDAVATLMANRAGEQTAAAE